MDARLEYGEGIKVSVSGFEEEVVQGQGMVSSHRLSRGRHVGGSGHVFCDVCVIGHKGFLDNRMYNGVGVHSRR